MGNEIVITCIVIAGIGSAIWWAAAQTDSTMRHIPGELRAAAVAYAHEESMGLGFLPGDNEAGVIVYALPANIVATLRSGGEIYLDALNPGWPDWQPTPVADLEATASEMSGERERQSPAISFVNRFGVQLDIDPAIAERIDDALTTAGSFYHRTRGGGLLIVTPTAGEAYFIYAG